MFNILKKRYQEHQQRQEQEEFLVEKNYFQQQTPQKNIKRVYDEEVTDSEGEDGSNTNTPVEENTEQRQNKQRV